MGAGRTTNIAAIDAGSNAIRLVIARADSPNRFQELKNDRAALRLGRSVFKHRHLDDHTIEEAVEVFRKFKSRMNQYDVQRYRAVATSASREARNRKALVEQVYRASGIRLEVIDATEESRLVRSAVLEAVGGAVAPRMILDLGGGSLQVSLLEDRELRESVTLPLGTVRLIETLGAAGAMDRAQVNLVREYVETSLRRFLPAHSAQVAPAVFCGGNAEALAALAPGAPVRGIPTLDLGLLRRKLPGITSRDVKQRMSAFLVRKDRADVMAIAAIVFDTLARWWGLEQALVPAVGVKEGVLSELVRSLYAADRRSFQPRLVVAAARRLAAGLDRDPAHSEHVRALALQLFDQLAPLHGMGKEMRLVLEVSALLHDAGHGISRDGHHRHAEYLVRNAELGGLQPRHRDMAACVVRYHSQSEPDADHRIYASLPPAARRDIRGLVALLRIADRLDVDHRGTVRGVRAAAGGDLVRFRLQMRRASDLVFFMAQRGAELFEKEFHCRVRFERLA